MHCQCETETATGENCQLIFSENRDENRKRCMKLTYRNSWLIWSMKYFCICIRKKKLVYATQLQICVCVCVCVECVCVCVGGGGGGEESIPIKFILFVYIDIYCWYSLE